MSEKFIFKRDRRVRRITWAIATVVLLAFLFFHFVQEGDYLPAWMLSIVVCVIALYLLSIPRYITVDDEAFEIHCMVELTRIHVEEIETMKQVEPPFFKKMIPVIASYGFGGYYGYYLDLFEWSMYKVYATERKKLVLIEDIYEDSYLISCSDPERLIALTLEARDKKREEIFRHSQENLS